MLSNYIKIALRHLSRNRTYVLINVLGMGIAIAWCILAYVNYQYVAYADLFHEDSDRIVRMIRSHEGENNLSGRIKGAYMQEALSSVAGIEKGTRLSYEGGAIQYGDKIFNERIDCVDPSFLEIFTFPLTSGDPASLKDPSKVILSTETAERYFGDKDPIGEVITVWPGTPWQASLSVGGVAAPLPKNSFSRFEFLTNIDFTLKGESRDTTDDWRSEVQAIFFKLRNGEDRLAVNKDAQKLIAVHNERYKKFKYQQLILQPINEVYKNSPQLWNNSMNQALPPVAVWGLGIIALMILLTACLNFTNTTISFSNKRLKEMGVRKVMGGGRAQIVYQLLGESFILCLASILAALFFVQLIVPWYNSLWGYVDLELTLNYMNNIPLLVFLVGTLLLTTFLGGVYPAFYISGFSPTQIFRGSKKFGGDNWMVKSLLGFQIVIAIVTIVGGIAFAQNIEFQKNMDLGYKNEGVINVRINGEDEYNVFGNAIKQNPDVLGIAGSQNNLGFGNWWNGVSKEDFNMGTQVHLVGENFIEMMGFELLEGRSLDKEIDFDKSIVVNETFMKDMQGKVELGGTVEMYDKDFTIVGVVKDFVPGNFFDRMSSSVFHFKMPESFSVLKVRTTPEQMIEVNKYLEKTWRSKFPLKPFSSFYQDELMAQSLTVSENVLQLSIILSLVTLLLSATGLFALVSLNLLKRSKEIAIRKVLGASGKSISYTINRDYVILFIVCGIIGGILGALYGGLLIGSIFEIYQDTNPLYVVLSVLFVLLIGFLTIGGRMISVLRANPAEVLKSD